MHKITSAVLGVLTLIVYWFVLSALLGLAAVCVLYAIDWLENLPIIGAVLKYWSSSRGSSGGVPPLVFAIFVNGIGGFICALKAFEKTMDWLPGASIGWLVWGFSVLVSIAFVIAPMLGYFYGDGSFTYTLNAVLLGIGGIAGIWSSAQEHQTI